MGKILSQSKIETSSSFAAKVVGILSIAALFISCEKATTLDPLGTVNLASTVTNNVQLNFCTPPAVPQKQYLKTVIVLDHSGSNAQNYKMTADGSGAPDMSSGSIVVSAQYATDPTGTTRYGTPTTKGTLLNYLNTLPANDSTDPTRFFALVDFNSSATTYPAGSSGFTSDIAGFYNYTYTDSGSGTGSPNDTSGTSYLTALTSAYNIINNDIQSSKSCAAQATTATPTASCPKPGVATSSSYVIVFMSDGSPITSITISGSVATVNRESTTDILGKVGSIMALTSNDKYVTSVNIFTIYYYFPGNVDTNSQSLLAQMAKVGNGLSYNALSGSSIDYTQFQPPQKILQYSLSDVFVTNSNGVWWTDGKFHLDSDGDGLPDDIEATFGTDPLNAYSDNNGVSDFVKYTMANGVCNSHNGAGRCTDAVTNYKAGICSGISTTTVAGKLRFNSSDPNGLNDCEKIILNDQAGIANPDSNADSIPDWLEFINSIPFQVGSSPAVTTVLQDGYTTYQKIKYSLPVNFPLNTMPDVVPANYSLNQISSTATQSCYQLNVTSFPISSAGATDKVRIDVIMKSNLVKDSYLYKVGYKSFSANNTSLIFNDWNDATEITNKTWSQWP